MSTYNNLVGLIAVNNIGNGIGKVPANSTILVENFNNQTAILDTPLNKYIASNLNPDGTSRQRGNIEDLFTQEQLRLSPLHRSSFPIGADNNTIIDYDWDAEKPAVPAEQEPGIVKKINLREVVPINQNSTPDFKQFNNDFHDDPKEHVGDSIYSIADHKQTVAVSPPLRAVAPEFVPGGNRIM
jgi:hypothetical protein